MTWLDEIATRLQPTSPELTAYGIATTLALAAIVVVLQPVWQWLRLGVTLVHELGHGLVGVLVGRTFTGFVVGGDGSGHAVTSGSPRGLGRVVTTWAGYPMPALVGVGLAAGALAGWAAPVLFAVLVVLALTLLRIRSALTLFVVAAVAAGVAWLWWSGSASAQAHALVAAGALLLVGAWRHVFAVLRGGRGIDDHRVLAQLTHVPGTVWVGSWIVVMGAATWWVATSVWAAVRS
ncbi:MAG: M50 family metallopeptidase [Phycicoccus sp.]|nr:M50 family metallopeptidase [Phycicoccus sp.]